MKYAPKASGFVGVIFVLVVTVAAHLVIQAPNDYQHGITGKILYIHVPSAWLATLCYTWMTICALITIFRQAPLAYLCLKTTAPIGATFTLLTLVSGALWGRPAWGTWWVWDARLTSVLALFILYLMIIMIGFLRRQNAAAILTLFGFCLVPIIKFSVVWWQTLHQPTSVWRDRGSAIEAEMLLPLFPMTVAFLLLFIFLHILSLHAHLLGAHLQLVTQPSSHAMREVKEVDCGAKTLPILT